jgi:hypothetical protein
MKTQHFICFLAAFVILFTACKKEPQVKKEILSGYAQKGPLVNGSSIIIAELNTSFYQTGKTYHTTIFDDLGSFELNNIELVSQYVELKAEGYYFNEILGRASNGPLTLYTLADVKDINSINVNVLTHLEKPRVEYLIKQQRLSFAEAKRQAQKEVLAIFGFMPQDILFERLNLTSDAKLLAISCILQGVLTTGEMMELMAQISANIRQDGKLDNMALGSQLMTNALHVASKRSEIRDNLTKKYAELGVNITVPDFESCVESFINSELYPQTEVITYPATGSWVGDNILSDHITEVKIIETLYGDAQFNDYIYGIVVDFPLCQSLKIVLKGGEWNHTFLEFLSSKYDETTKSQMFRTQAHGILQTGIAFINGTLDENNQEFIIIEYYENGATTPTKIKRLNLIQNK